MSRWRTLVKRKLHQNHPFAWFKRLVLVSVTFALLFSGIMAPKEPKQAKADFALPNAATVTPSNLGTVPKFNFLGPAPDGSNQGDLPLLRAANHTQNIEFTTTLNNINIGDEIGFLLYFHNGVPDTVARNTTVRVDLPAASTNRMEVYGNLWSADTPNITRTFVEGLGVIGAEFVTLNLKTPGFIQYQDGTTKLLTRKAGDPNNYDITQLQNGIIKTPGVGIGNIQGCWPYAGFVYFKTRIIAPPALGLTKQVKKAAGASYGNEVKNALPGEEIDYLVTVTNTGGTTATNVVLKDRLPQGVSPVSVPEVRDANGNIIASGSQLFSTGLAIPDLSPGAIGVRTVNYRVKIDQGLTTNNPANSIVVLSNLAQVFMAGVLQREASTNVYVAVFVAQPGLQVVKNIIDANGTPLNNPVFNLLDTITYQIVIRNTGNVAITDLRVHDALPQFVRYIPGSTFIDARTQPEQDLITIDWLPIGTIQPGQTITVRLSGDVYGCPPAGEYTITNTAAVAGSGVAEQRASATAKVRASAPTVPGVFN